jgi:hypothetical protein
MIRRMRNKNNTNNGYLAGKSSSRYFKDSRSFSIIVFMVSLMTVTTINTPVEMKRIPDLLAFFGLGNSIVGVSDQSTRVRK